jgi:hypothetical protein
MDRKTDTIVLIHGLWLTPRSWKSIEGPIPWISVCEKQPDGIGSEVEQRNIHLHKLAGAIVQE